jgi:UDP-N-acetylmuramyl-tripeptide synthetase
MNIPSIFPVTCHTDFVGQNSCFVAIEGYSDNGIKYIKQAIEKGARTIVVHHSVVLDDELCTFIEAHNVVVERVDNTRKALANLSAQAAEFPAQKLKIIGITGTKGKTTTSFLLEHILSVAGYKTALISSAQNRICGNNFPAPLTTPQPDYLQQFLKLCVDEDVDYVVMEVAAQALTLHRVEGITFCGVIFTNFSLEHLEFYPTLDDYFKAKSLIFLSVSEDAPLLINADDEHGQQLLDQYQNAFAYGFLTPSSVSYDGDPSWSGTEIGEKMNSLYDYHGTFLTDPTQLIELSVQYQDATEECYEPDNFVCPVLFGAYNAYNVLAASSMVQALYVHPGIIKRALQTFPGVPGRLQEHVLPNGARCFIDYAHNPESFKAVLSTLRALTDHLIVVFGAGGGRDKSKRPMMGNIASQIADIVVITSDNPRLEDPVTIAQDIVCGIAAESHHKVVQELDRKCAIELAYHLSDNGSIIVLLGKGPDEYQIIGTTKHYFSERQIVEQL